MKNTSTQGMSSELTTAVHNGGSLADTDRAVNEALGHEIGNKTLKGHPGRRCHGEPDGIYPGPEAFSHALMYRRNLKASLD